MTTKAPAELLSLIESLPEPHILLDRSYNILAANRAYRAKWEGATDIVGRRCYEVSHRYTVPCDEAGESCPLRNALASGQRERVVHLHHTPSGEHLENIELSPVRDGHGEIAFFVERVSPLSISRDAERTRGLVGRSLPFVEMMELVARVAPSEAAVLLAGESGTGKELVANAIHQLSRRADKPFVAVDCSGLAETLFESELFGHERGAFTGANTRKIGLVEAAAGGTLFLDEVGDIPLTIQVKLLRLLETGTFRRVGSVELQTADIRVISATHRPLAQMATSGTFRQDLFYRLNVFPIHLPPLRARRDDIALLAGELLTRVSQGKARQLSAAALHWLQEYPFPGNVRELRNMLERACLLCDGDEIEPRHLPLPAFDPLPDSQAPIPPQFAPAGSSTGEASDAADLAALAKSFRGSRRALAARLGLSERTLYRRLKELGIDAPDRA